MIVCDVTRISPPFHYNLFAYIPAHTNIHRCRISAYVVVDSHTHTRTHSGSLFRARALQSRTVSIKKYTNHNNNLTNNSSDCSPELNTTAMSFTTRIANTWNLNRTYYSLHISCFPFPNHTAMRRDRCCFPALGLIFRFRFFLFEVSLLYKHSQTHTRINICFCNERNHFSAGVAAYLPCV